MENERGHGGPTMRLSVMMFLQFFVWGAWFATLGLCLGSNELGAFSGGAYGSAPIGAMIAPLFLGLIADRFFPSQIVMGVLFLIGGALLLAIPNAAAAGNGELMVWLMIGNMLTYMPTLGLANSVAFSHLDRIAFPKVRVWGTIGWIAAGLVVGILGWSAKFSMFYLAGAASLVLGAFSFVLPHTPAPAKGEPVNLRALLMVDAFGLFKRPAFAVFMICSMLICVPLAYYYGLTSNYLQNTGFLQPASTMTIGQMSEIIFMLLIPFFFRRLGVKWMILVGMLAWVARYLLFAFGAPDQIVWMLFLGVALHGICYDFFFVTGFMYTDKVAPKKVRSQAQSMLVFFTQGIGMYVGYAIAFGVMYQVPSKLFGMNVDFSGWGGGVSGFVPLEAQIKGIRGAEESSFLQQLGQMFSMDMPDGVDPDLLTSTMEQWKEFWILPALIAGGIAVLFFLSFWDKIRVADADEEDVAEAASPDEKSVV
ncbi:MFS transporter [Haloferula sp. A504]|uniref:MFS transporter n=1 Tax=Haloferula sp. A504 TaxID=3373601 RepID=UPI0031BEAA7F|nr:MFS transporter [Verrucomicrobiaceae bacterium E54]